ncbi:hypothetical protein B0H65DRAFT_278003 [Neurospora tetraspora]|uniref:NTF2 and RRM domain-containing protein n=1 Tax=Neurospora tetraspora TaxID=94610 RepID=A0AAE0MQL0_9PEZI|nr:hypothetical protein B0H65DRAFT_278003 [Neurospora tetraspora]
MATNGNVNHSDQYAASSSTTEAPATTSTTSQNQNQTLPKDEVGWYFVEQYYTTLSKNPEKLHLFYGKKSQFVYGQEAEISSVSYGRQGIQERIKGLDFQDSKVRISNVDSQGSGDNIVIQVIGETSSKGAEPKKFVQTFVLAQQPSGYFVLNDMLRYIKEEVEEEVEEPAQEAAAAPEEEAPAQPEAPVEAAAEPVEEAKQPEPEAAELDASTVDQKLEEVAEEETPAAEPVEAAAEPVEEAKQPEPEATPEQAPEPEKVIEEITREEVKKPEEPKAPSPTPAPVAAPAAAPPAAEPEKPKEPPKPKTWANLVAVAAGPKPVVPLTKAATPAVPAQTRAAAPAAAQQPAAAPQATETAAAPKEQANEWQTAETKRQSRPQSMAASAEKETAMAYIKYVTDKVKEEELKGLLSSFGELVYFDINRTKNCAFVEFKTQAGYNAAVAANPHTVNGENIVVEQRRPKSTAFGGSNYGSAGRGGAAGRGRGGFEGGRSGSQSGGRGGFGGQSRGRGGANRGRAPTAQPPTA